MAANGKDRLRITRLRLERWRNFDAVDIPLQGRALFVGPNASGKSNLLDAIRFLRDIAAVGGGLEAAVQRRGGMKRLRSLSARRTTAVGVGVDIGTEADPALWKYDIRFDRAERSDAPRLVREVVVREGKTLLERPDDGDRSDPLRLHQTHLEQIAANQQFRALAGFFDSVRYLHIVPQLVREPYPTIHEPDPFGSDLIDQLADAPKRQRESRLKRICEGLRVAVPQLSALDVEQDRRGVWHLKGKYDHWRPKGAWQTEEDFSDGTLRLLGMLWAVLEDGGPLLLEEPELSLHAEVARHLPAMFARMRRQKGRQVLLSTHSEALLSDPGIGLDEVFLLTPGREGTEVTMLSDRQDVRALLEGGQTIGEAVIPMIPVRAQQLGLFS